MHCVARVAFLISRLFTKKKKRFFRPFLPVVFLSAIVALNRCGFGSIIFRRLWNSFFVVFFNKLFSQQRKVEETWHVNGTARDMNAVKKISRSSDEKAKMQTHISVSNFRDGVWSHPNAWKFAANASLGMKLQHRLAGKKGWPGREEGTHEALKHIYYEAASMRGNCEWTKWKESWESPTAKTTKRNEFMPRSINVCRCGAPSLFIVYLQTLQRKLSKFILHRSI